MIASSEPKRGFAEAEQERPQGLGRTLAERSLTPLQAEGIQKCHLFVRIENEAARAFWEHLGWVNRNDIQMMSRNLATLP